MKNVVLTLTTLFALVACGSAGQEGDPCSSDADCADGLECHMEEHGDEEEEEGEEHDHEEGVCESHDDHDHD